MIISLYHVLHSCCFIFIFIICVHCGILENARKQEENNNHPQFHHSKMNIVYIVVFIIPDFLMHILNVHTRLFFSFKKVGSYYTYYFVTCFFGFAFLIQQYIESQCILHWSNDRECIFSTSARYTSRESLQTLRIYKERK